MKGNGHFKVIDVPAERGTCHYESMASQLKRLPAGKALEITIARTAISNMHTWFAKKGMRIRTRTMPGGKKAVWLQASTTK